MPAILRLAAPASILRLDIATLGFSRPNTNELFELLDAGQIRECTFVCSVYFRSVDTELFTYLDDGLKARGHRCEICRSHAKLLLFELSDGRNFVWESSANLRSCRNAETFVLSQSAELLSFHRDWLQELITRTTNENRK